MEELAQALLAMSQILDDPKQFHMFEQSFVSTVLPGVDSTNRCQKNRGLNEGLKLHSSTYINDFKTALLSDRERIEAADCGELS